MELKITKSHLVGNTEGPMLLITTTITDKILFKLKIALSLPYSYIQRIRWDSGMTVRYYFKK